MGEVLRLDTWFAVLQYQWFCKILGPGINLHLASNHMLREIFELGDPLPVFDGSSNDKPSKEERHAANQLARKIRTGIRGQKVRCSMKSEDNSWKSDSILKRSYNS